MTQTFGALAGQVQVWEQTLPEPCSVLMWQEVAPTGQHSCCSPAEGVQPKPQVNSAQKSQVNVLPQTHAPFWQAWFCPQTLPQAPQLFVSVCRLLQLLVAAQNELGLTQVAHRVVVPPLGVVVVTHGPWVHTVPHAPQLFGSLVVSTHLPLQSDVPLGQAEQTPL